MGIVSLIGGIGFLMPPLWDHDAWKKFANINVPNYPAIFASFLGQVTVNAIALIAVFISIYLLFIAPMRKQLKEFDPMKKRLEQLEARTVADSDASIVRNTFVDCHFNNNDASPLPPMETPSRFSGTIRGSQTTN